MMNLRSLLIVVLSFTLSVSCTKQADDNPFRRELNGLIHANGELKESLAASEARARSFENLSALLQKHNEQLTAESATLAEQIEKLTVENGELLVKLGETSQRESEANRKLEQIRQQREIRRQEEAAFRQKQLQAIAEANKLEQPPFRAFDVIYIGKKKGGYLPRSVGRFSVRNYTDQPLVVHASTGVDSAYVSVPPNHFKEDIEIAATKGGELRLSANGHTEVVAW